MFLVSVQVLYHCYLLLVQDLGKDLGKIYLSHSK